MSVDIVFGPAEYDGRAVHTIPVPHGWSVEQAWEAIVRGEDIGKYDPNPNWDNVLAEGTKIIKIYGNGIHWEEHGPVPEITSEDDDR